MNKSRKIRAKLAAKTSDIYHQGLMNGIGELNEAIGNFYALMNAIIVTRDEAAPVMHMAGNCPF
jgi:hypothetical protein